MRPILLSFAGLRSYRAQADIDFGDLDLFAVIGDTGAGKSTIIEALSLALYARKTWQGGASLEDMIADGEKALRVEFTFAAEGHEWTVTRSRNRNTTPGVNKLVCVTGTERVDGASRVTERITELLGLDHAQFTRAVVLPQGRFDELLRATPAVRNKLLGSILGLDDVKRVGVAADLLARRWHETLVGAGLRRGQLPVDPDRALAAAEAEASAATERLAALQAAVTIGDAKAAAATSLHDALRRLTLAVAAVPIPEGDPRADLETAAATGVRLGVEESEAAAAVAFATARLDELRVETVAALGGFATRDAAVGALSDLKTSAASFATAAADAAAARARMAALEADPPAGDIPEELVAARAAAEAALAVASSAEQVALAALAAAGVTWTDLRAARQRAEAAACVREGAERQLTRVSTLAERAVADADAAAKSVHTAERRFHEAVTAQAAAAAAEHCAPGDPCPVCARDLPEGFTAPASADITGARSAYEKAKALDAKARDAAAGARRAREQAHADLEAAEALRTTEQDAVAGALAAAEALRIVTTAGTPEAATVVQTAAVTDASAARTAAAQAFTSAHDAVTEARAVLVAAREAHTDALVAARAAVTTAEGRALAQQGAVAALPEAWRPEGAISAEAMLATAAGVQAMLDTLDVLDRDRREVDAVRATSEATIARVKSDVAEQVTAPAQRIVGALNARLSRVRDVAVAANAALEVVEMAGVGPLEAPADLPGEILISRLPDTTAAAVDRIASVDRLLGVSATTALALTDRHTAVTAELDRLLAEAGHPNVASMVQAAGAEEVNARSAQERVADAKTALDEITTLDQILAVVRPFHANLSVLVTAMRDQHFVGYLVSAREAELLAEASRRLKAITNGRFGFVADFGIVSIASGEVRTPDTLSGGERFQAALALALALIEIASRGGGTLDAVFVDEGFGSLDSAALEMALETLGTVAGGGKLVALISHLRPVAEYVETVLHVTKDDVLGSTITRLDPDARDRLIVDDIRSGLTA